LFLNLLHNPVATTSGHTHTNIFWGQVSPHVPKIMNEGFPTNGKQFMNAVHQQHGLNHRFDHFQICGQDNVVGDGLKQKRH